jgi:site-specific recombinase
MRLSEGLLNPTKKAVVVDDCCNMIETQLASKPGLSGIALKTAFAALKGIKPGYIPDVVEMLLPQCFDAIDPIWNEGVQKGNPVEYLVESCSRTSDVLLNITDVIAKNSTRKIVRGTYEKFRGSAKQHVEAAVPDFAKIIEKYTKS